MDAIDYEQKGYIKGADARVKSSGYKVILVSNPKYDATDNKIRVWVAMDFDVHVRYLALVDDLELI